VAGDFEVTKATLMATANNESKIYGEVNPLLTISYTGFKNGENSSVIDTEPSISTTATMLTGVSTIGITLSGGVDNNAESYYCWS